MNSAYIITGITFIGSITVSFNDKGFMNMVDFSNAELSTKQLEQFYRSLPITEDEFIKRADASGANYRKAV